MKRTIKRRKYRINKVRLIEFILINLVIISLITWGSCFIVTKVYDMVTDHDESAIITTIGNIEINEDVVMTTHAEEVNNNVELEVNHIDYDKKPEGLDKEYYKYMVEISKDENIPLEVILAIVTVENPEYNINAYNVNYNDTVDMGLCQINSDYVDYFAKTYDIDNLDPYNPKHAITFVARHMKYLSEYAKDNYNLSEEDSYLFAAGAYNRGIGNEITYRNMYTYKENFKHYYNEFLN